jgi:hypothetical protein
VADHAKNSTKPKPQKNFRHGFPNNKPLSAAKTIKLSMKFLQPIFLTEEKGKEFHALRVFS